MDRCARVSVYESGALFCETCMWHDTSIKKDCWTNIHRQVMITLRLVYIIDYHNTEQVQYHQICNMTPRTMRDNGMDCGNAVQLDTRPVQLGREGTWTTRTDR